MRPLSWLRDRIGNDRLPPNARRRSGGPPAQPRRLGLESLEVRDLPSTLPVNNPVDDATQHGTLRYAVAHAGDGDTILLTGAVAYAGITLTQGELVLCQHNLTIRSASAPNPVTIDGGNQSRVFEVASGASVELSNLIITGGNAQTGDAADPHEGRGGGIVVDEGAALTMTGCTVTDSTAPFVRNSVGRLVGGLGGGIADFGTLTVNGCTISDNHALGTFGGGIAVFSGSPFSAPFSATTAVSNSTLTDNTANQNGGAVGANTSTVTVDNCVVTGNTALTGDGGAFNNHSGVMTVSRSLLAGNTAPHGWGGGIFNYEIAGTVTVLDSVISGNSARFAGGIGNLHQLTLCNSQLSDNTATEYYAGALLNGGTASVVDCRIDHNSALQSFGGGIYNEGNLTISGGEINNNAAQFGGGIDHEFGTLILNGCELAGNSARSDGGAIYNDSDAELIACTLTGNTAGGSGGAVVNEYRMAVTKCTLAGNAAADSGGAIDNEYAMAMTGCTVTGNTAGRRGGGIYNNRFFGATVELTNTTVADNGPNNVFGGYLDRGGNTVS
jgi:hypothetical protein